MTAYVNNCTVKLLTVHDDTEYPQTSEATELLERCVEKMKTASFLIFARETGFLCGTCEKFRYDASWQTISIHGCNQDDIQFENKTVIEPENGEADERVDPLSLAMEVAKLAEKQLGYYESETPDPDPATPMFYGNGYYYVF